MKRRDFLTSGACGAAALSTVGCSSLGPRSMKIVRRKPVPETDILKVTKPKPGAGSLKIREVGRTGIKVTNFAFGSHIPTALVPFEKERGEIIRQALDHGITTFDVYDKEQNCFQYEPMGRHLKDVINDVVISITCTPYDGRSFEEEFHRDLKAFGRDYIDMVRIHTYNPDRPDWENWEKLFKYKEQGKIRAVGIPIHWEKDLDHVLDNVPIDYVLMPYNFYHNLLYTGENIGDIDPLGKRLKDKGIGVVAMKAMASEWFMPHFVGAAKKLGANDELSLAQAMLKFVINSELDPDTSLVGMWSMNDLYDILPAYFNPRMSAEEADLLEKMRTYAKITAEAVLPDKYRFLHKLAQKVTINPDVLRYV